MPAEQPSFHGEKRTVEQAKAVDAKERSDPQPHFERATEYDPILRQKILVYKPFRFSPAGNKPEQTHEIVPAVFHVLKSDKNWVWIGDEEGNSIGQVERRVLGGIHTEWNTKYAMEVKAGTQFFNSPEDAISKTNPVHLPFAVESVIFPQMAHEAGKAVTYYKVGYPLGVPLNLNIGFPLWVSDSPANRRIMTGVMLSDQDIRMIVSKVEQVSLMLEGKKEPFRRGDITPLLNALQNVLWNVTTGEDRAYEQLRDKNFSMMRTSALKTMPMALSQKDASGFMTLVQEWQAQGKNLKQFAESDARTQEIQIGLAKKNYRLVPMNMLP